MNSKSGYVVLRTNKDTYSGQLHMLRYYRTPFIQQNNAKTIAKSLAIAQPDSEFYVARLLIQVKAVNVQVTIL